MATFTPQSKTTTTLTNESPTPPSNLTLADYGDLTLADAEGTLGDPRTPYSNETKNTTVLTNQSKN